MDRNNGGVGAWGGSTRTEPGATVLTRQVVLEEESLAYMTSHPVSLLVTDPHQLTERPTTPASRAFTRSSSCSENTAEMRWGEIRTYNRVCMRQRKAFFTFIHQYPQLEKSRQNAMNEVQIF